MGDQVHLSAEQVLQVDLEVPVRAEGRRPGELNQDEDEPKADEPEYETPKQREVIDIFENTAKECERIGLNSLGQRARRAATYTRDEWDKPDGIIALANDMYHDITMALVRRDRQL